MSSHDLSQPQEGEHVESYSTNADGLQVGNVPRYRQWCFQTHGHGLGLHSEGELVAYTDYAALLEEIERLKRERADLLDAIQPIIDELDDADRCGAVGGLVCISFPEAMILRALKAKP